MICTTIEQGKLLLDAGVDKSSADMHLRASAYSKSESGEWLPDENSGIVYIVTTPPKNELDFPAWSLSALWGIMYSLDRTYEFGTNLSPERLIETLVKLICVKYGRH